MRFIAPIINAWRLMRLGIRKPEQVRRFQRFSDQFEALYRSVASQPVDGNFVTPFWDSIRRNLEPKVLPRPRLDFFRIAWIRDTMVAPGKKRWIDEELTFLSGHYGKGELASLLQEDRIGGPMLTQPFMTSPNTLHHAYHWGRFFNETKTDLQKIQTIVEWGGGYGNAAKLARKLLKHRHTYVIIDIPLFSCLQWLYLASILGEDQVHILKNSADAIEKDKINLVPLGMVGTIEVSADLFLSTWALSESNDYAQDFVAQRNWFGAKHLLLAFQQSDDSIPFGSRLGDLAQKAGASVIPIPFVKKSSYAFR